MRLVVRRIEVLSIPTAWEIYLSANATRTIHGRQLVMLGSDTIEIQTQECHGLLSVAGSIVGAQGWITGNHTEVVWKGFLGWRVIEEVVNDSATAQCSE
jgi:hypothetical protein